MNTDVMFSSETDNWETPQEFFDEINAEFNFLLDACANENNAKVSNYYTVRDNGLLKPWENATWCNPPYGREIGKWVKKSYEESLNGNTVVMLVPARTDTRWFHDFIYNKDRVEVRFVRGRLKFSGAKFNAPFPCMLVIFHARIDEY